MEGLKTARKVVRTSLTRTINSLSELLSADQKDHDEIKAKWELVEERYNSLKGQDDAIFQQLLEQNASEAALEAEMGECDNYILKYNRIRTRYHNMTSIEQPNDEADVEVRSSTSTATKRRKFKLPTLELRKFGGNVKEWLPFWAQFEKIHDDDDIAPEDKFTYLSTVILPNTRARDLLDSYPPTAGNYPKAVESLKARFGREDLLIEVYVRELLNLVLNKAVFSQAQGNLSSLYDQIETQLRALETLGVATDTCAAMLYPLVESCLPEDLLRIWQRSADFSNAAANTLQDRLTHLMSFLRIEVESEERITVVKGGFTSTTTDATPRKVKVRSSEPVPTAAGLVNHEAMKCVFCDEKHESVRCFKAAKMSYDEKRKLLVDKRACFKCAKTGHRSRRCNQRLKCLHCGSSHISLLCPPKGTGNSVAITESKKAEIALANYTDTDVLLQTLRVKIKSASGVREIRALIDTGSQRSYILKSLVVEMNYVPTRTQPIIHSLFGGTQTSEVLHQCYDARLASLDDSFRCRFEVLDQGIICDAISPIPEGAWWEEVRANHIPLSDVTGKEPIQLLIGADVAGKLLTGEVHKLSSGPVAVKTLLGWVLMGKIPIMDVPRSATMTVMTLLSRELSIDNLWKLETIGIQDPVERQNQREAELNVINHFRRTIKADESGRYEVALPWKECHPPVPNNLSISKTRLSKTLEKLQKGDMVVEYEKVLDDWLRQDIIEMVPESEWQNTAHYLPHRPVVKTSSTTTKIRPVFDASAHERGAPSLNDCLETGENLIELIPKIIMKFRLYAYGIVADIEKAFLQIEVDPKDRDWLRFLWQREDGSLIHFRHRRVVFGLCCSPFLLAATLQYHLNEVMMKCPTANQSEIAVISLLLRGFYVDNLAVSVPTLREAEEFRVKAGQILASGKFHLREWETSLVAEDKSVPLLGLMWNPHEDVLTLCPLHPPEIPVKVTKRTMLSAVQRIFDPIGFTCPATLGQKVLLQQTWNMKLKWDDEVPADLRNKFILWCEEIQHLYTIRIPRWTHGEADNRPHWSVHTFVDASHDAYAAVIFLRVGTEKAGEVHLILAKVRVSPLKKLTIPRLELMAASIGARLYSSVREALPIEDTPSYFWTDSSTVLAWIKRDDVWKTFVWNRIQEIRTLTNSENWYHVPGVLNPADLPSRGCTPRQLKESNWWLGPKWLRGPQAQWPNVPVEIDEEKVKAEKKISSVTAVQLAVDPWYYRYFSRYPKIVRLIAWVGRFVDNCRSRASVSGTKNLSSEELIRAEIVLLKLVQKHSFQGVSDPRIVSLSPIVDKDGVIRVKTPIINRVDIEDFRFPILLPPSHPVVERLIQHEHQNACHAGTQTLLSILRERFWIMGGRRTIRSIVHRCVPCRKVKSNPFHLEPPALPINRVGEANVFEITGVDLAGPLTLKCGQKTWIVLYTCAIYRAVHLELTTSLSTSHFLQSLRRFVARRGRPRVIYSDNGTNFVGAEGAFDQIDWSEIETYSATKRIIWKFNPPTAAWWGGWWERLVQLVKQLLRRVLGKACLSYEELLTTLCDCESVINSRPITYASNDPTDLVALTPRMFLSEYSGSGETTDVVDCDVVETKDLSRRVRYRQKLSKDLRNRFRVEYLGQLRSRKGRKPTRAIQIGELVLMGRDNVKRFNWPLGRVVELIGGKDGKTRLVKVRTGKGILLRPIQRLYPLECALKTPVEKTGEQGVPGLVRGDPEEVADVVAPGRIAVTADPVEKEEAGENNPRRSRSGRLLKAPVRYSAAVNLSQDKKSDDSLRWEDVEIPARFYN